MLAAECRDAAGEAVHRFHPGPKLGPWFRPEVAEALQQTVKLLESLGHSVERHDLTTDPESAWRSYNQVNAVQTALDFDDELTRWPRTTSCRSTDPYCSAAGRFRPPSTSAAS